MRWKFIANIIGILLIFLGLSMVVPLLVSIYYQDLAQDSFIRSIGITMVAGLILIIFSKKRDSDAYINQKKAMAAVALAWTTIGFFGALPFYFGPLYWSFYPVEHTSCLHGD